MKTRFNLKELLRNKLFISCTALVLILAVVITSVFLLPGKQPPNVTDNTPDNSQTSVNPAEVSVDVPTSTPGNTSSSSSIETDPSDIVVDVGGNTQSTDTKSTDTSSRAPAQEGEKPVTESTPSQPNNGGIVIGGGDTSEPEYDCHTPNHHCKNPESHAFVLNLELEGCPYCGSHSCPSFYGTDEWGNAGLFPKLCPKYDIHKDPVEYCQVCGRKNGNGDNNTCQKFIVDATCPICGKLVKANECHTH